MVSKRQNFVSRFRGNTSCRVTGPAPQGVELEKSQELTIFLRTVPICMLK